MIDKKLNYGRAIIKEMLKKCDDPDLILDLGAGHGDDLISAKLIHPAAKLYGVEIYKPYAEELAKKGVYVCDINIERDAFPFVDSSVDVVIANQILEHTKEIFWIAHEVSRILKVGGKFIIGVPNLASLHNRLLLLFGRQPTPIKSASAHVRGFTKNDLLNFFEEIFPGGYELSMFAGSNFYPFPPKIAQPLSKTFPSFSWGIFFLLEKKRIYDKEFIEFPRVNRLETNFYIGHN